MRKHEDEPKSPPSEVLPSKKRADENTKGPDEPPPSVPSTNGSTTNYSGPTNYKNEVSAIAHSNYNPTSLTLKAVDIFEKEFWHSESRIRNVGILTVAINHLYSDVFRVSLAM